MNPLNLLSRECRANPHPTYAELRRLGPTRVDPGDLWAVARYDDVVAVLKNPAVFSSQGFRAAAIQPWIPKNPIVDSLVFLEPPRHTSVRALVTHAFSTRVLPRVEPLARKIAGEFAQRVKTGVQVDICEDLAMTLPAAVIANLLGFDLAEDKIPLIRAWADDLHSISAQTPAADQPRIKASINNLAQYISGVIESRRRQRQEDLTSDLLDATNEGGRLTDEELIGFMVQLLVAGFETTGHLISQAMRILIAYPKLLHRLRANIGSIPDFIDELLRYEPSVHGLMRLVVADTHVSGVAIPAGSVVLALVGAANRDETRYEDPERFDMDRKQRQNLAFGHGIHFCLGAALARAEVRSSLEEILPHIVAIQATGEIDWNCSLTVRGPVRMPIRFQGA